MLKKLSDSIAKHDRILYIAAVVLVFPALLINLGNIPLQWPTDEARRALVALEMILSGNYITPTINGEFYYNKPPLYNWLIVAVFKITGQYTELAFRVPVVIALLLFAFTIWYTVKKRFGSREAFIHAIMFVTCGRILFYDSFLGLIDIAFSWVVYMNFMCIFLCYENGKLKRLFILSYLLAAVGFLMKGLPSVVFQGLTLLAFFTYNRKFRILLNYRHFIGIFVFFAVVGAYYLAYLMYNPGSLETVFTTLFNETTRRTVVRFGFFNTLEFIFLFPFSMVYHFAPWSFLVIVFAVRGVLRKTLANDFILFNFVVFLINVIVYWTSPETLPRYMLMLAPLSFSVCYYAYQKAKDARSIVPLIIEKLFFGMILTAAAGSLFLPFLDQTGVTPLVVWKSLFLFLLTGLFAVLYHYQKNYRFLLFAMTLLVVRIGFNWFVLPHRIDYFEQYKNDALTIAGISQGKNLYIFRDAPFQDASIFYVERERGEILRRKRTDFNAGDLYIVQKERGDISDYEVLFTFRIEWEKMEMNLIRFKPGSETLNSAP